jgi:hypothetical protein
VVAAGVVVLLVVGCSSAPEGEQPLPPVDGEETAAEVEEPTEDAFPWVEDYTEEQVRAYEQALQRWERYEELVEPVWAEGRATDEARTLFQRFFAVNWEDQFVDLQEREAVGVRISGTPRVHWSEPSEIRETIWVSIDQCIDTTPVSGTQDGQELPSVEALLEPHLRTVVMVKNEGRPWRIMSIRDSSRSGTEIHRCEP